MFKMRSKMAISFVQTVPKIYNVLPPPIESWERVKPDKQKKEKLMF